MRVDCEVGKEEPWSQTKPGVNTKSRVDVLPLQQASDANRKRLSHKEPFGTKVR
jgi:hypothetical protein